MLSCPEADKKGTNKSRGLIVAWHTTIGEMEDEGDKARRMVTKGKKEQPKSRETKRKGVRE